MATLLEDYRTKQAALEVTRRYELKDKDGNVFHPNIFVELEETGINIWTEAGGTACIPDEALPALKTVIQKLLGKVS